MELELPDDWKRTSLGDLGTFHKGRGGPKRDDQPEGTPVVRYGELYTHHHEVIRQFQSFVSPQRAKDYTPLQTGDLLFAGAGETVDEIGKSAVFLGPEPARASGDLIIFRPDGRVDPLFLGYASNGRVANAHKRSVGQGSSILHLYGRDLQSLELPLPPLLEQRKIATILSSLDDAIAATGKVIEQTKRVQRGLLQTLMTRGIGHTRFQNTEIGVIPEAWEVVRIGAVSNIIVSNVNKKSEEHETPVRLCNYMDVYNNATISEDLPFMEATASDAEIERFTLHAGDVIITKDSEDPSDIAVPALVPMDFSADVVCGYHLAILRPSGVSSAYLSWALRSKGLRDQFERRATGTTRFGLRIKAIEDTLLPLPPAEEQLRMTNILGSVHSTVIANRTLAGLNQKLKQLHIIKRGLMEDLLTGRVRVNTD